MYRKIYPGSTSFNCRNIEIEGGRARYKSKKLANLLEVSPSRISEYLSGTTEPTLKVARTIGKKLSIDPHILLGL